MLLACTNLINILKKSRNYNVDNFNQLLLFSKEISN